MKTAAFSAAELRFWGWIPRGPDLSDFYAKGRGGPGENAPGDSIPPWGRKADPSAGLLHGEVRKPTTPQDFALAKCESRQRRRTFPRRSAKADNAAGLSPGEAQKPTTPQDFPSAKCESRQRRRTFPRRSAKADLPARTSSRRSAKADDGGRLSPGPAFGRPGGPGGGENGALPYSARKSQFLRNGDVSETESLFLFAVLWLAFLPRASETGVAGGEKPAAPNPRPPARRPAPTTATGSRFLRRQRKRPPRQLRPSPPAREGSLGAPNDRTFPPGAERKARKGKENERRKPHAAPAPGLTTAPPDEGWEAPRLNPQDCVEEVCHRQTCKPKVCNLGLPAETRPASRKARKITKEVSDHDT